MAYIFSMKDKYNKFRKDYESYEGSIANSHSPEGLNLPYIHSFSSSEKFKYGLLKLPLIFILKLY